MPDEKPKIERYTVEGINEATAKQKALNQKRRNQFYDKIQEKEKAPQRKLAAEIRKKPTVAQSTTSVSPSDSKVMYQTIERTPKKTSTTTIKKDVTIPVKKPQTPGKYQYQSNVQSNTIKRKGY